MPLGATVPVMKAGSPSAMQSAKHSGIMRRVPSGSRVPLRNTAPAGTTDSGLGSLDLVKSGTDSCRAPSGLRTPWRYTSVPLGSTLPSGLRPCLTNTGSPALTAMSSGRTTPSGPRRPTRVNPPPGATVPAGVGLPARYTVVGSPRTEPSGAMVPDMKAGSPPAVHSWKSSGVVSSMPSGLRQALRNTAPPGSTLPGVWILDLEKGVEPGWMEPSGFILPARNTSTPLGSTLPPSSRPQRTNTGSPASSPSSGLTRPSGPRRPAGLSSAPGVAVGPSEPEGLPRLKHSGAG